MNATNVYLFSLIKMKKNIVTLTYSPWLKKEKKIKTLQRWKWHVKFKLPNIKIFKIDILLNKQVLRSS